MNKEEQLTKIVCSLLNSGHYTYAENKDIPYDQAFRIGWKVTWFGQILDHAKTIQKRIENEIEEESEDKKETKK